MTESEFAFRNIKTLTSPHVMATTSVSRALHWEMLESKVYDMRHISQRHPFDETRS